MASWQDASAASQQLELDAAGRQLLAAALNTNPAPHETPLCAHTTLANPERRRDWDIVNTYLILAEGGVNFCKTLRSAIHGTRVGYVDFIGGGRYPPLHRTQFGYSTTF